MILARFALVLGLFGVPAAMLWLGHRLRDRSPRQRGAFWGGTTGHTLAIVLTLVAALMPPIAWQDGGFWRDFTVHWSMVLGFLAGVGVGVLRARGQPAGASERRIGRDRRERPDLSSQPTTAATAD